MIKKALNQVLKREDLSIDEATEVFQAVMSGDATKTQIAALLVALRMKGESTSEIIGAASAMRNKMQAIHPKRTPLLDTCGTGGSGTGKFNVSTAAAFVCAGAGVAVAKHGNKAVSSSSGSADLLRALGATLELPEDTVCCAIDEVGVGFLFAPSHHPAMRFAAPVRKELGIRTLFNVLGPLTNPAGAKYQLLGVFDAKLVSPLAQTLGHLGTHCAWVVHGHDGIDELSLSGPSKVAEWKDGQLREFEISPQEAGLSPAPLESVLGGSPQFNASILKAIFSATERGPLRDIVVLNAAAGLVVVGAEINLSDAARRAEAVLDGGAAMKVLNDFVTLSQS